MIYTTGSDTYAVATLTSTARTVLDDSSVGAMRDTLGLGSSSAPSNGQILIGNGSDYSTATLTEGSGITITNGSGTITIASSGSSSGWGLTGNSGTTAGTNFIGTTDETDLQIKVGSELVTIYQFSEAEYAHSIVSGMSGNTVKATVRGSTIAGGGDLGYENTINDHYGFIGGGIDNTIGSSGTSTTDDEYAVIGGGENNTVDAEYGVIPGGYRNHVNGKYGIAMGSNAVVNHEGAFVFRAGQSSAVDLNSSAAGEFTVMAHGGLRFSVNQSSSDPNTSKTMYIEEGDGSPDFMVAMGGATEDGYVLKVHGSAKKTDGTTTWATTSDKRLKKDIQPIGDALAQLLALKGVSYLWRNPENHGNRTGQQLGFIAQDMQEVFPSWVKQGGDGYLNINPVGLEALTVEAIRTLHQQTQEENKLLKEKIDSLEARLERLEARL